MVTAEGHEVGLSGRVKSFQSPGHKASLRFKTAPLKPKNGLNGPPALPLLGTVICLRRGLGLLEKLWSHWLGHSFPRSLRRSRL